MHLLADWIHLYHNLILFMDEFVTSASSIVNGVTVNYPVSTMRTLRELCSTSSHVVVMDVRRRHSTLPNTYNPCQLRATGRL